MRGVADTILAIAVAAMLIVMTIVNVLLSCSGISEKTAMKVQDVALAAFLIIAIIAVICFCIFDLR